MKKIFSITVAVLLCLNLFTGAFAAGNALSCRAAYDTAKAGDTAIITVSLNSTDKFKSLGLTVKYDNSVFQLLTGEWTVKGATLKDVDEAKNRAAIAFSKEVTVNDDIFEFSLKVKDNAPSGTYQIKIEPVMKNGASDVAVSEVTVSLKVEGGSQTVSSDTQSSNQVSTQSGVGSNSEQQTASSDAAQSNASSEVSASSEGDSSETVSGGDVSTPDDPNGGQGGNKSLEPSVVVIVIVLSVIAVVAVLVAVVATRKKK